MATTEPAAERRSVHGTVRCPRCALPMDPFDGGGHYGNTVHLDLCAGCASVWFDHTESLHLGALGWVGLLRRLSRAGAALASTPPTPTAMRCPRCAAGLQTEHNRTRFGRFRVHRCGRCRGHLQSQVLLLAQQGLLRPLNGAERAALLAEARMLSCRSCGAPLEHGSEDCRHCGTPALVVDLQRLAAALQRGQPGRPALGRAQAGQLTSWNCHGCGSPFDPTRDVACGRCGHVVVMAELSELSALLDAVQADLERRDRTRTIGLPVPSSPEGAHRLRELLAEWFGGTVRHAMRFESRWVGVLLAVAAGALLSRCL